MAQPVELPDKIHVGPVIDEGHSLASVSDKVGGIVLKRKITLGWVFGLLISFAILQNLMAGATWLIIKGVGVWGINIPVGWGFAIINFVWWIGIGHAGTLISAILLLLNQSWRNAINRFAEAMTLFAVMCAGMFPVLHTGRPWLAYWLFPYPNTMDIWPQFRSPLLWDVFAVSTYLTISAVFWFVGLLPDLATLRDTAKKPWQRVTYGALAMGWRGSARHWQRYEKASLLLAGLATPLVVSVHTVVSFDFAVSIVPGWHTTIFPPYFVAGAIYSGFAMVLTLMIPVRQFYGLQDMHHDSPSEQHGEGHARHRADCRLRLHDGSVFRLLQRRYLRAVHDLEPYDRPVRAVLLVPDPVQHHYSAIPVVQEDPHQSLASCGCSRSSSISGCGWSGSSSS